MIKWNECYLITMYKRKKNKSELFKIEKTTRNNLPTKVQRLWAHEIKNMDIKLAPYKTEAEKLLLNEAVIILCHE